MLEPRCAIVGHCVAASSRPRQSHAMPCLDAVINGVDLCERRTRTRVHCGIKADPSDDEKTVLHLPQMKMSFDYDGSN
jgi:hypothetical protein